MRLGVWALSTVAIGGLLGGCGGATIDVDNPPASGLMQFSQVTGTPPVLTTFKPWRGYMVSGDGPYIYRSVHLESAFDATARNTQILDFTYVLNETSGSTFEIGESYNGLTFEDLDGMNNTRNQFKAISGSIRVDSRKDNLYTISLVDIKLQKEGEALSTCTLNGTFTVAYTFGAS
jgi:hypothetical protein